MVVCEKKGKMLHLLEKHFKVSLLITFLIAIFIFSISSLTFEGTSAGFGWKTILYHFVVFFLLAFFLLPALVQGKSKNFILLSIILAILYGVSDEIHQLFVPGRNCSFSDIMVNSAGILSASLIYSFSFRRRSRKSK